MKRFVGKLSKFSNVFEGKKYIKEQLMENQIKAQRENDPEDTEDIFQFFTYAHLPDHLKVVSQPFASLAEHIVNTLPRNAERTVALRKLLESKDAAVRSKVSI